MSQPVEIRMPKYPECWESCGSCAQGEVFVLEVLVQPGDRVAWDDPLITLETGKVALDIPSPHAGRVLEVHVTPGDTLDEGALIAMVDKDAA